MKIPELILHTQIPWIKPAVPKEESQKSIPTQKGKNEGMIDEEMIENLKIKSIPS